MTQDVWCDRPTLPLLQWLARGSLKQNLLQAIRLWVWLHLLYGDRQTRLSLPEPFSYADWRDTFFTSDHPPGEAKPDVHDSQCPCVKVTAAWLFGDRFNLTQVDWSHQQTDSQHSRYVSEQVKQFHQHLVEHGVLPQSLESLLYDTRLFGVTRRTLASDLYILVEMHWLKRIGQKYQRVEDWPERSFSSESWVQDAQLSAHNLAFLAQPDLAAIADNLSRDVQGHQRFFVHVDYVVAQRWIDRVDERQEQLRQVWQQRPIPPMQLDYQGAGQSQPCNLVVYPVCIYYYRRAPYLCGYGQVPDEPGVMDFRNYRLDRIEAIAPLRWQAAEVPPDLYQTYECNDLPTPDEISEEMAIAWGFDYYKPVERLILRFDQEWNRRYIRNSLRHETFEPIAYNEVERLIQQKVSEPQRQHLLQVLHARDATDAYYQALHRQDDPNVKQRLRAWRPHVEVLLPWSLRQRMAAEVRQEALFYQD